jgi:hypothetical protein
VNISNGSAHHATSQPKIPKASKVCGMDAPLSLSELRSRWNDVLDHLESHDRVAWIAYFDARLAEFDGVKLSLDFSDARKFSGGHEYSPTREKLQNSLISSIEATLNLDIQIEEI